MAIVVKRSVTSGELPLQIPDGAVTTSKLADSAVTGAKIDAGAVTNSKIGNNTIQSGKIKLDHTTDSAGWTKMPISAKVNMYMKYDTYSDSWTASSWKRLSISAKPTDLNTSNTFFGWATGRCGDNAISTSGAIDKSDGTVNFQSSNAYTGSVSTTLYWTAVIIELLA